MHVNINFKKVLKVSMQKIYKKNYQTEPKLSLSNSKLLKDKYTIVFVFTLDLIQYGSNILRPVAKFASSSHLEKNYNKSSTYKI